MNTPSAFQPPPDHQNIQEGDSSLSIWSPLRSVVVTRATGKVNEAMAQLVLDFVEPYLQDTSLPVSLFHHWSGVTSYESKVRPMFVRWGLKNLRHCAGFHFLTGGNRVLAMGVALASMVVPRVHSYSDEAEFMQSYDEVMQALGDGAQ